MKRTTSSKKIAPPEPTADTPRDESTAGTNDDFIRMMAKLVAEVNNSGKTVATTEEPKPKRTKKAPAEPVVPESPPTEPPTPSPEPRPKKQLTEKQLSALAAGRAKNSRFRPKN